MKIIPLLIVIAIIALALGIQMLHLHNLPRNRTRTDPKRTGLGAVVSFALGGFLLAYSGYLVLHY